MKMDTLKAVLNGLTSAVFIIDKERRVILQNDVACDIFGNGFTGADFVQVVRHPDCLEAVDKVLSGHKKSDTVITLQKPVRTIYQVTVTGLEPNLDIDNTPAASAMISLDNISHVRDAEQMRSEFIANVSHELRSPLTVLNGFIETLKGPAKDDAEARARFLEIMDQEARRMNRLIEDLLSLSKVEATAYMRPEHHVDIFAIVHQVIMVLEPQAKEERLTIRLAGSSADIKQVPGDEDQLSQVFLNLIENAIKYSKQGTDIDITVNLINHTAGISGQALAISVKDHGAGIPAQHIPRLTERFYRVDNSRSREKGGTGLGLAIVKHILTRHRGRLSITSGKGQGSTFTVYLPAGTPSSRLS